ncbi:MAG: hypothetical protein ACSLEM_00385 [Candidatus Malihini olakiniferum]
MYFEWYDKHGNRLAREMLFLCDQQAVRFVLQMLLDVFLQK